MGISDPAGGTRQPEALPLTFRQLGGEGVAGQLVVVRVHNRQLRRHLADVAEEVRREIAREGCDRLAPTGRGYHAPHVGPRPWSNPT